MHNNYLASVQFYSDSAAILELFHISKYPFIRSTILSMSRIGINDWLLDLIAEIVLVVARTFFNFYLGHLGIHFPTNMLKCN